MCSSTSKMDKNGAEAIKLAIRLVKLYSCGKLVDTELQVHKLTHSSELQDVNK